VTTSSIERPGGEAKQVLLTGAYGHGNLGDDLLAIVIGNELREQGLAVAIAAGSASRVARDLPQTPSVLVRQLGPENMLLLGGGGLFNDAWNSRYSRWFSSLAVTARLRGAAAAALGLGIEPPRSSVGHLCLAVAGRALAPFGVRDVSSAAILARHRARDVRVGIDLGWLSAGQLSPDPDPEPGLVSVTIAGETEAASRRRLQLLTAAISELLDAGVVERVRGVAMQRTDAQDAHDDRALLGELARQLGRPVEIVVPADPWEAAAALGQAPLSLGFRLHGLLLAYVGGSRVIAISRSQKVTRTFAGVPGAEVLEESAATPAAVLALAEKRQPPSRLRREHALAARAAAARHLAEVVAAGGGSTAWGR
jgi:polysaccharide pyruvyl transferase WcaK-like protein